VGTVTARARRGRSCARWVLWVALLLPARALASGPPAEATSPPVTAGAAEEGTAAEIAHGPELDEAEPGTLEPSPLLPEPAIDPKTQRRQSWGRCAWHVQPCTRSRAARMLLLSLGLAGGAASAGLLFGLGDRLVQSDPATLLVGAGTLAGVGAVAGAIAGRLGAEGPALRDRVRPATVSLAQSYTGPRFLDEVPAHATLLRFAPNLYMPSDTPSAAARLRLFGHVGGWLVPVREVDPRPQFTEVPAGQVGTSPAVLRQRRLSIGLGLDLAVPLPYPVLAPHRSARMGPAELRWRPEVQIRRDWFAPGTPQATSLERTILLPLTVGVRWHLSARQRFTIHAGPRFDMVAFSDRGSDRLRRGGAQIGPLYGEAWYDVDVPFTNRPRRDGRPRKLDANGQLTLGYVHAKIDGQGFDFGPVIGFLGPIHVGWATRLRPTGAPVATQIGAFARIGNTTAVGLELGLVAPDLHLPRRSR
jgi:hypothetical protein